MFLVLFCKVTFAYFSGIGIGLLETSQAKPLTTDIQADGFLVQINN